MTNIRKRAAALALMLCMVLTMMPTTALAADPVARVGEQSYDTLDAAWDAAIHAGGTEANPVDVTLLQDVTLTKTLDMMTNAYNAVGYVRLTSEAGQQYTVSRASSFTGCFINMIERSGYPTYSENINAFGVTLENVILDGGKESGATGGSLMIAATKDANITLNNGAVLQNNDSAYQGAALCVNHGSAVINDGAVIQNNSTTSNGGGVYIAGTAQVVMNGGTISGNTANNNYCYGGGVSVGVSKTEGVLNFEMKGGTIENNTAYDGGGIYYSGIDHTKLTGGMITGNKKSNRTAQEIYAQFDNELLIGGDIQITGPIELNKFASYVGKIKQISEFTNVTKDNPILITYNNSNKTGSDVVLKGEGVTLKPEQYALSNTNQKLILSEDGNSLISVVTSYTVSMTAVLYDEYENWPFGVINDTAATSYEPYQKDIFVTYENWKDYIAFPNEFDENGKSNYDGFDVTFSEDYETVTLHTDSLDKAHIAYINMIRKPLPPKPSVVTVDYANQTVSYDADTYEMYAIDYDRHYTEKDGTTKIENGSSIAAYIPAEGTAEIYVRTKRTETKVQSRWSTIELSAPPAAVDAPTLASKTTDTVVLNEIAGCEYSKDNGVTWQDSTTFDGLDVNTSYDFVARVKAVDADKPHGIYGNFSGAVSEALTVTTDKLVYDMSGVSFANDTVTYDGKTHSLAVANLPENVTATYEGNEQTDAGTYTVIAHFTEESGNYNPIPDMTATLTIDKAEMSVTGLTGTKKFYDGTTAVTLTGGDLTGIAKGDTVTANVPTTGTVADKNVGTDKAVSFETIVLSGPDAGNYTLIQPTAAVDIVARVLTITGLTAQDRTYNSKTTVTLTGGTLTGVLDGDEVSADIPQTANAVGADIGTQNVTVPKITLSGADAGNYVLTQPKLTVVIKDISKFADDNNSGNWSWASNSIYACVRAGIVSGYEDSTFRIDNNLTRAEAAAMLARAAELNTENATTDKLSDIAGHWGEKYIAACVNAGIINGYEDGSFRPDAKVTRAEFVKMLVCAQNMQQGSTQKGFSDVSGHWAESYINIIASNDIVGGYEDNTFRPNNNITRGETAKILAGAYHLR